MQDDKVNTPQAEENSATNPSTQATEKQDVPYSRFQNVIGERNELRGKIEERDLRISKMEAEKETARQEVLKKNQEFETLYNETQVLNKSLMDENTAYKQREADERKRLMDKVPEDEVKFTNGMDNNVLAEYLDKKQSNINANKTDSSRAGATAKGEWGGYGNATEWAQNDPDGFTAHLEKNVKGYIK